MKQKLVIRVSMNSKKCRSKAMKIAVGASGVDSAALKGDEKDQIELIGDGIDAAELTRLLRKKMGYAVLESLSAADEKKEEKEVVENEAKMMQVVWPTYHQAMPLYHDVHHVVRDPDYGCSIM